MKEIEIVLQRAPDDPKVNEPKFQEELGAFSKALHATGLKYSQRAMAFDSAEALGFPLPEFTVVLGPAIGALAAVCGAWVQARYGRKVRLKVGDVEAEARTIKEVEELFKRAEAFRDRANGQDNGDA